MKLTKVDNTLRDGAMKLTKVDITVRDGVMKLAKVNITASDEDRRIWLVYEIHVRPLRRAIQRRNEVFGVRVTHVCSNG
jgi:hypothetical protein